ncbi:TetR/AcrR family transcriptional regulator [Vibrio sp. RC27]
MGKSAKFDRTQVIEKATDLYWEKGFHGTSMRNLQDVIDMRPGSIYATFGSKEGLFKESLKFYTEQGVNRLAQCLDASTSPLAGLKLFMHKLVINADTCPPSGMCMLAKTVSELTDEQPELLQAAKDSLKVMEQEFEKVIIQAQEIGELDKNRDSKVLARHIQIQITGLRSYARIHDGAAPLEQMIEDVFEHFPFKD